MTGSDTLEVERKYDVGESDPLPPLASLPGVDRVGAPDERNLDAVYFDTGHLALASRRITLRRRTGGNDAGWHLKLPVAAWDRREMMEPLGSDPDSVPPRLQLLVRVHSRDQDLVPVARLKTRRAVLALYAADGTVLAEFSDDHVDSVTLLDPPVSRSWREWEIELVHGPREMLEAADALLAAEGHYPAALPSKLARALASKYPSESPGTPRPTRHGPASAVLWAYMHQQVQAVKAQDPGVRQEAPDAVHQLRVAARRMRSALATYRKLTDAATANLLRVELQWLAGAVGDARDTQVMRDRLKDMISAEPPDLLLGPVAQQVEEHLGAQYHDARATGLAALESDRYFRLLGSLDAFVTEPPFTGLARKEAAKTAARLVAADRKRLQKAVRVLTGEPGSDPADAALHEVRKCAKRLRYAAEAAAPVHGKRATRLARATEEIQEILGEHQDSVLSRELLRDLGAQAHANGANGFSYGRLHALEQQHAQEARVQFLYAWKNFAPKPLRWK